MHGRLPGLRTGKPGSREAKHKQTPSAGACPSQEVPGRSTFSRPAQNLQGLRVFTVRAPGPLGYHRVITYTTGSQNRVGISVNGAGVSCPVSWDAEIDAPMLGTSQQGRGSVKGAGAPGPLGRDRVQDLQDAVAEGGLTVRGAAQPHQCVSMLGSAHTLALKCIITHLSRESVLAEPLPVSSTRHAWQEHASVAHGRAEAMPSLR